MSVSEYGFSVSDDGFFKPRPVSPLDNRMARLFDSKATTELWPAAEVGRNTHV